MSKKKNYYSRRTWLNPKECSSTGSIAAFHGVVKWRKGDKELTSFLEISDCHGKIRLHKIYSDSNEEFVSKLKLLVSEINLFINFLEENVK